MSIVPFWDWEKGGKIKKKNGNQKYFFSVFRVLYIYNVRRLMKENFFWFILSAAF